MRKLLALGVKAAEKERESGTDCFCCLDYARTRIFGIINIRKEGIYYGKDFGTKHICAAGR